MSPITPDKEVSDSTWRLVTMGYAVVRLSTDEGAVDTLTLRLIRDGYRRLEGPHWTGDGYYESVVLDPEGNRIEITV